MEQEVFNLRDKRIEQSVVAIGAKVADAVEMVQRAKEMTKRSEAVFIKAQLELEELYISLDQRSTPNLTNLIAQLNECIALQDEKILAQEQQISELNSQLQQFEELFRWGCRKQANSYDEIIPPG